MKHARHAADCFCPDCLGPGPDMEPYPPTFAFAYFQPWNYPETHARHQRAEE